MGRVSGRLSANPSSFSGSTVGLSLPAPRASPARELHPVARLMTPPINPRAVSGQSKTSRTVNFLIANFTRRDILLPIDTETKKQPPAAGTEEDETMKPFSTYPEDRAKLLELAAKAANSDDASSIELADLVTAILTDEQALLDAEIYEEMTEEFSKSVDQAWENFKTAIPVAKVVNDNQPGKTAIIEILTDPPTLAVGMKLFAAPVLVTGTA